MQITTGATGKNHVTSENHRNIIASLAGTGSYIANILDKLEPEAAPNNKVKIASGALIHHGCVGEVAEGTYDEVPFEAGTPGMKRVDLVVARYKKDPNTNYEEMDWYVIQGTPDTSNPVTPAYIEGNMQTGDLTDDCPFCKIILDGVNVEVEQILTVASDISTLQQLVMEQTRQLKKHTETLSNNEKTLADYAKMLKDHNSKLELQAMRLNELETINDRISDMNDRINNLGSSLSTDISNVGAQLETRISNAENRIQRLENKVDGSTMVSV